MLGNIKVYSSVVLILEKASKLCEGKNEISVITDFYNSNNLHKEVVKRLDLCSLQQSTAALEPDQS